MLLVIATGFAFGAALLHDVHGTIVSLLVAGAGAIELHGVGVLGHGEVARLRWLVTAQVYLMFVMLTYVLYSLQHADIAALRHLLQFDVRRHGRVPRGASPGRRAIGHARGRVPPRPRRFLYLLVGLATVLVQGGMAVYYARRQPAISEALR